MELPSQGEFLSEFVDREVEAHARRQTVNRRKPQANRTEVAIPDESIQDGLLDLNLEFRIERNWGQGRRFIDIPVWVAHLPIVAAGGRKNEALDFSGERHFQKRDRGIVVHFPGEFRLPSAGRIANNRGQVNNMIDRMPLEDLPEGILRTDIASNESEIVPSPNVYERLAPETELIENDDAIAGIQQMADQRGSDVSRATRYKDSIHPPPFLI